jgi:hypothetical protein
MPPFLRFLENCRPGGTREIWFVRKDRYSRFVGRGGGGTERVVMTTWKVERRTRIMLVGAGTEEMGAGRRGR